MTTEEKIRTIQKVLDWFANIKLEEGGLDMLVNTQPSHFSLCSIQALLEDLKQEEMIP